MDVLFEAWAFMWDIYTTFVTDVVNTINRAGQF